MSIRRGSDWKDERDRSLHVNSKHGFNGDGMTRIMIKVVKDGFNAEVICLTSFV